MVTQVNCLELSTQGLQSIGRLEGCKLQAYKDSAGIATIGYGNTYLLDGSRVSMSTPPITENEALVLLKHATSYICTEVNYLVKVPLNQSQFDALVSLVYNIGVGAFTSSTLLKLLNAGDFNGAAEQFLVWNRVGKQVNEGLSNRRQIEYKLFLNI